MKQKGKSLGGGWSSPESISEFHNKSVNLLFGPRSLYIDDIQYNIHRIGARTSPHSHRDFQIIYYLKGSGWQRVKNKTYHITPRTVLFISPETTHSFRAESRTIVEAFTLRFDITKSAISYQEKLDYNSELITISKLFLLQPPFVMLSSEEAEQVEHLIRKIEETLREKEFGYLLEFKGYLILLVRKLLSLGIKRQPQKLEIVKETSSHLIFLKASAYLKENALSDEVNLKKVAEFCHKSGNYLQKIFKTFLGYSFTHYLQRLRIDYAKELLRKDKKSKIASIAGASGFYDINYFTRVFKKIEGCTPSQFRLHH